MRSVEEWIGKTDDTRAPPRVHLRRFLAFDGRCQCGCNRPIRSGESWQLHHATALINGGKNCESNLVPVLTEHHKNLTRQDVREKSKVADKRMAHLGIKRKSRPMPGSKASGFKRKVNGTWERRQ